MNGQRDGQTDGQTDEKVLSAHMYFLLLLGCNETSSLALEPLARNSQNLDIHFSGASCLGRL